jgi:putative two-component system response regulator
VADSITSQYARFARIAQVGVALAGERYLPRLYELILRELLALTNAQIGVIYIREGDSVQVACSAGKIDEEDFPLQASMGWRNVLTANSLCGAVILEDKILNISDVRVFPEEHPASLWPEFIPLEKTSVKSLLALPLNSPQSGHMGVATLLNARDSIGRVVSFDPEIEHLMMAVTAQAALAIQNVRWNMQLHQAYQDTLYRLSLAAEYREDPSGSHIRRVSQYAGLMAQAMGLPEERVEKIRIASAMHDIGKLSIPEEVLLKPGKFTPEEFEQMKRHTTLGAVFLGGSQTEILQIAERIALTHHEKWDGSGYPYGQAGADIPLEGRMVALADVFDALTTPRPYKSTMSFEKALDVLKAEAGKHFDPACVDAFLKSEEAARKVFETTAPKSQPAKTI